MKSQSPCSCACMPPQGLAAGPPCAHDSLTPLLFGAGISWTGWKQPFAQPAAHAPHHLARQLWHLLSVSCERDIVSILLAYGSGLKRRSSSIASGCASTACQISHLLLHTAVQGSEAQFNIHALWNGLLVSCKCAYASSILPVPSQSQTSSRLTLRELPAVRARRQVTRW